MTRRRLVLFGLTAVIAHGSGQAARLLAAEQQPTFQSTTRLIQVSVVVHDKNGQPVSDLTAATFGTLRHPPNARSTQYQRP